MNIEQIAINIKDTHGLDISDESAITFLRHAISKMAIEVCSLQKPCAESQSEAVKITNLYTEKDLIAAQQRTAEACAKVCEATADKYQETESRLWPECRSDAQSGASSCEGSIRNGDWREYL